MSLRKVVFRVDASLQMGTGHVMRCLTLADLLQREGVECHFVCREHPGHLLEVVSRRGHAVHRLPLDAQAPAAAHERQTAHAGWLGAHWQTDLQHTAEVVRSVQPQWVVVDHYALDAAWERQLKRAGCRILVVDDLADRPHDCDMLVDQTVGRQPAAYQGLVPRGCRLLTGAHHALLRPEFGRMRPESLSRRRARLAVQHVLVTMGGVDQHNVAVKVLRSLDECALPEGAHVTVVMGRTAPWLAQVREQAAGMRCPVQVLVDVQDMAQLMASCDVAIGAAGSTSWERCCLGVPTLMLVLADNQRAVAAALEAEGAAVVLGDPDTGPPRIAAALEMLRDPARLGAMIERAGAVTDGRGAETVLRFMLDER